MFNILQIPAYFLFRHIGLPAMMPISFTFNLSYHCNSRCLTCNIWKKQTKELTKEEWGTIFRSLGSAPYWTTITGGEPFLRQDLVEIVNDLYSQCRPRIINLPTNGLLPELVMSKVDKICTHCQGSKIIVNISMDGTGEEYDRIRGVTNGFESVKKTYQLLRGLKHSNLTIGIGTVISKFNIANIEQIYEFVMNTLKPDSYVTEIAEQRHELDTLNADISPTPHEYAQAADFLCKQLKKEKFHGLSRLIRAFRLEYYRLVKRLLLENKKIIPCYSGFNSCLITPDGEVWPCCIRPDSMGNLQKFNYNFKDLWFNRQAQEVRRKIKKEGCFCPLANAAYTNMLCHPLSWGRILANTFI
ncbi:MAG: radical SAM protein [bacterium]